MIECTELLERVVDRMWLRVEACVVLARLLIDAFRICRKLVIESVEIDPFASLHQALLIGTAEVEVP